MDFYNLSRPCFKSAIISSASSSPTDILINPSDIPASALSSGVYGDLGMDFYNLSRPCFKSAIISSASSSPTDILINPSDIPASALSSGVYGE